MSYAFLCDGCGSYFNCKPDIIFEPNGELVMFDHPRLEYEKMHFCRNCTEDFLDWQEKHLQSCRSEAQNE